MFRLSRVVFLTTFVSPFALAGTVPKVSAPVWLVSTDGNEHNVLNIAPADRDKVAINTSNNNLAIKIHGGRLYFAFRSATHHHPKPPIWAPQYLQVRKATTRMYVLSTKIGPKTFEMLETEASKLEWRLEMEVNGRLVEEAFRAPIAAALEGKTTGIRFFEDTFGHDETKEIEKVIEVERAYRGKRAVVATDVDRVLESMKSVLKEFDLREPFFFVLNGKLHFYFAQIEGKSMRFNPLRAWNFTLDDKTGQWSKPTAVLKPKEQPWDIITHKDRKGELAYLSSYSGAHYVVNDDDKNNAVHLRESRDGVTWEAVGGKEAVYRGGASEAALVIPPGSKKLFASLRLDDGDERGWGSLWIEADLKKAAEWPAAKRADPQRFDSPRMFADGGEIYLVARQNLCQGADGKFDETVNCPFDRAFVGRDEKKAAEERESLFDKLSKKILTRKFVAWQESDMLKGDEAAVQKRGEKLLAQLANGKTTDASAADAFNPGLTLQYEYTYHFQLPKRTTLYRFDKTTSRFVPVLILPSAGDTSFPSIERLGDGEYLIANYSSNPTNRNWTWRDGQQNRTGIYLVRLTFPMGKEVAVKPKR